MEHEKKKRQKKKKNKQGKTNEKPPTGVGEVNNHANVNNQNLNSENADVHNKGLQQRVVDSDRESISGAETSHSVEAESYSSNREASLQQKIKELQEQLEVHVLRETDLERNISQSQKEINLWHHKEIEFETRILQLETEKDCWLQKEAGYQEKVNRLVEETNTLNNDNARLQAQVMEVEASINDISHQNKQLKEHVSVLQSKIQNLENSVATHLSSEKTKHVLEDEEMNTQLESARALIEKLVSENEKLIEKVNNLNAELDRKSVSVSVTTDSSFPNKPDDSVVTNSEVDETSATETDPMLPEKVSSVSKEGTVMRFKSNNSSNDLNRVSMESGEIVQIPLDENDVLMVPKSTNAIAHEKKAGGDSVPLTDAPLIGAPFRFISLVARYVSGADLVEKS